MKNYTFRITEVLTRTIEVKASDDDKAYEKVSKMYADEEIVLSADDFSHVTIYKDSPYDKDFLTNEVIDYLYLNEQKHYEENPVDNHIFLKLEQLKAMLN